MTRSEIGDKLFISTRTVEKHAERIFLKVGAQLLGKLNKVMK